MEKIIVEFRNSKDWQLMMPDMDLHNYEINMTQSKVGNDYKLSLFFSIFGSDCLVKHFSNNDSNLCVIISSSYEKVTHIILVHEFSFRSYRFDFEKNFFIINGIFEEMDEWDYEHRKSSYSGQLYRNTSSVA